MIKFFLKYFIYNGDSKTFKNSFLLPFSTILIGSFVILLSFAIMDGFSSKLYSTIYFFDKEHSLIVNKKILNSKNSNNTKKLINFLKQHDYYYNSYEERVMFFKDYKNTYVGKVFGLYDMNDFLENNFLILKDEVIFDQNNKYCIIGYDKYISTDYNLGDEIKFVSFSDFYNLNSFPNRDYTVVNSIKTNISNYDNSLFLPYDSVLFNKNIFLKINLNRQINDDHMLMINTHYNEGVKIFDKLDKFSELFSAIEFEKISYVLFGIFIVLISSIMLMGYNITSIFRNLKALALIETLGISKKHISIIYLLYSTILGFIGFFVALLIVSIIISLDKYFLIMDYIFDPNIYFNFDLSLNYSTILFTFFLNTLIIIISTIIPIYKISKLDIIDSLKFRV